VTADGRPPRLVVDGAGHLSAAGQRVRLWGVNLTFDHPFVPPPWADRFPHELKGLGFNSVRLHHLDNKPFPLGLLQRGSNDSSRHDPEALARLDHLLWRLGREGIYVNLNLLVSRPFLPADGFGPEIAAINWKDQHVAAFYEPRMLALQRDYARSLLNRINPYTGLRWADDPALAVLEINNENGLIYGWKSGVIDLLPESLTVELQRHWRLYLAQRYADDAAWSAAWGPTATGSRAAVTIPRRDAKLPIGDQRRNDWLDFLYEVEAGYYADLRTFLRDDLRCPALVMGTAYSWSAPRIQAQLDIVDTHKYYDHPKSEGRHGYANWTMTMASLLDAGTDGPFHFTHPAWQRVAGKPFSVSEYLHATPNPHTAEGSLLIAAYGSVQDWDAVWLFTWSSHHLYRRGDYSIGTTERNHVGFFNADHPATVAVLRQAALLWHRDIRPSSQDIRVSLDPATERRLLHQQTGTMDIAHAGDLGIGRDSGLTHRISMDLGSATAPARLSDRGLAPDDGVADRPDVPTAPATGAHQWSTPDAAVRWSRADDGTAQVRLDTPANVGLIGFGQGPVELPTAGVRIAPGAGWSVTSLAALDGQDLRSPGRSLLTAMGRQASPGMGFERVERRGRVRWRVPKGSEGGSAVVVEAPQALIDLPGPAEAWTIHGLDAASTVSATYAAERAPDGRARLDLRGRAYAMYLLRRR
jgi:hypothetical protein